MKVNAIGFNITLPWNEKNSKNQNALGISYTNNLDTDTKEDRNNIHINKAEINSKTEDTSNNKSSYNSSNITLCNDDSYDKIISKLDDNISELKAKIIKCRSSNELSEESKDAIIKQIKSQIEELEKQKQDILLQKQQEELLAKEEAKEEEEEQIDNIKSNEENTNSSPWSSDFDLLISATNSTKVIPGLKDIKSREKVEKLYLEEDNIDHSYTQKRLKQINKSASTIDMNINNSLKDGIKLKEKTSEKAEDKLKESKVENNSTTKDNSIYINKYIDSDYESQDVLNILI